MMEKMAEELRELVGIADARKVRGASDITIWREIKDGTFPEPIVIKTKRYWFLDELVKWQAGLTRWKDAELKVPPAGQKYGA